MIDPGPDVEDHVRALASRVAGAERVRILLTHGHRDHAGGAATLAEMTGASVHGPEGLEGYGVARVDAAVGDGEALVTDVGSLRAVHTPGHTPEHLCFVWEERRALFAGDVVLGEGDTTWVADYAGCVADYLETMVRVRTLAVDVVYPAHGPPLTDPTDAWDRFEGHRRRRLEQVRAALEASPGVDLEELLDIVYGADLPSGVRAPARRSLGALVDHVRGVRPAER